MAMSPHAEHEFTYQTQLGIIPPVKPFSAYTFQVTDSTTGAPVHGALCILYSASYQQGEGMQASTDFDGNAGMTPEFFAPRSMSVTKVGYKPHLSNSIRAVMNVSLIPTIAEYTVRVFSNANHGRTTPSGALKVKPNEKLTVTATSKTGFSFSHWLWKGVNVGSANPAIFDINEDNTTITAVFTELAPQRDVRVIAGTGGTTKPSGRFTVKSGSSLPVTATPNSGYVFNYWMLNGVMAGNKNPRNFAINEDGVIIEAKFKRSITNGNGGNGDYPVPVTEHVFDNVRLDPGLQMEARKSVDKAVDTSLVLGGRINYTVKLESKLPATGCTYYFIWNNEILFEKGFPLWADAGEERTGVIDIPQSKIRSLNTFEIALTQLPATFNRVLFNVYVTLGYSETPEEDDPWGDGDGEWVAENAWWLALAGGAALLGGAALMLMRPPTPQIIVVGK